MFHLLIFCSVLLNASSCNGLDFSSIPALITPKRINDLADRWPSMRKTYEDQFNADIKKDNGIFGIVDAAMNGFTKSFRQILDSEIELFPVEDVYPQFNVYLCANFGKVSDMKTIRKVDKMAYGWHMDGTIDVKVYYEFEDFKISYGKFYFQSPVKTASGSINMSFKVNKIMIKISFLSLSEVAKAIRESKLDAGCVFYVKNFKWETLDQVSVQTDSDSAQDSLDSMNEDVSKLVAAHRDTVIKTMQKQVLLELYNQLPKKPLCMHENLIQKANEYEANKKKKFSSDFQRKCGSRSLQDDSSSMVSVEKVQTEINDP